LSCFRHWWLIFDEYWLRRHHYFRLLLIFKIRHFRHYADADDAGWLRHAMIIFFHTPLSFAFIYWFLRIDCFF
jgi:hypothetical protein